MNKSLSMRINVVITVVITVLLSLFGYYDYNTSRDEYFNELKERVNSEIHKLAPALSTAVWNLDTQVINDIIQSAMSTQDIHTIVFRDSFSGSTGSEGSVEYTTLSHFTRDENWATVKGVKAPTSVQNSFEIEKDVENKGVELGRLKVIVTSKFIDEKVKKEVYRWLLEMSCVILLLIITLMLVIKYTVTIPIQSITNEFKRVESGDFDSEMVLDRVDELGMMSRSFSFMRDMVRDKIHDLDDALNVAECARRKSENLQDYLNNIVNSMPSMIIGVDINGAITQWNSCAEKMTGVSESDALDRPLDSIIPRFANEMGRISNAIDSHEILVNKKQTYTISEETRQEDITIFPLTGGAQGAVIRVDDVTEQVQLERIMVQSEKMQSVGGLAAGMAHEINNPLAIITQGIQNIQRRLDPKIQKNFEAAEKYGVDPEQMYNLLDERRVIKFLEGGRDACERAAQIVKNMLLFSRKSDSLLSAVNLPELIEHTVILGSADYDMKKKYDFKFIDIHKEFAPGVPPVMCCAGEIEQVLLNLFKNAIQAMEEVTAEDYKPQLYIRLIKEHNFVRIEIEDNGPGIPEQLRKRIFEPFFTTKEVGTGTGLGLSVSYMIITQNHNGTFEVESEEGGGTKFVIRLPI